MSAPRVRFNEFRHNNDWQVFLIKDVANIQVGRDLREESFSENQTATHKFPVYSNAVENWGLYGFYDFEEYQGNALTIIGRGAGLGKAYSRNSSFGAIGRLLIVSPKNNVFDVRYFAEYVNFKLVIHNESGGIPQLPGSTLGMYSVLLPSLDEQTKIATFLTAIDEKIAQLTQKHTLLMQYKKGMMQQIFSQELRFKDEDGRKFPEWEEKFLGEICECLDNLRKPLNDAERQKRKGAIPYWGANNIMDYVNDWIFDEPIVLLAEDGGNFNEYKTRPIANISHGKCWVNNHAHVLKGTAAVSNEFLFYSLVHKNITGYVSGGTRSKLTKGEMLKILIDLPSPPEQTKIATFLTAIDDKLTHTQAQLTAVKQYKQALLQQMFV